MADQFSIAQGAQGRSYGLFVGAPPNILSISAPGGAYPQVITVVCDAAADGLKMFTLDHLRSFQINIWSRSPDGKTIQFKPFVPHTREFPLEPGSFEIRAWAVDDYNLSDAVPFEITGAPIVPGTPRPAYLPPGVTMNTDGSFNVPGSVPWDGKSIAAPIDASGLAYDPSSGWYSTQQLIPDKTPTIPAYTQPGASSPLTANIGTATGTGPTQGGTGTQQNNLQMGCPEGSELKKAPAGYTGAGFPCGSSVPGAKPSDICMCAPKSDNMVMYIAAGLLALYLITK